MKIVHIIAVREKGKDVQSTASKSDAEMNPVIYDELLKQDDQLKQDQSTMFAWPLQLSVTGWISVKKMIQAGLFGKKEIMLAHFISARKIVMNILS